MGCKNSAMEDIDNYKIELQKQLDYTEQQIQQKYLDQDIMEGHYIEAYEEKNG